MKENTTDLDFLSDVKLEVAVQVGSTQKLLVDILSLKEGDIVKLDKGVEEYIDIKVNDRLFAIGEIVVANDKYGVRVVDLA